jgi:hypothetical protein
VCGGSSAFSAFYSGGGLQGKKNKISVLSVVKKEGRVAGTLDKQKTIDIILSKHMFTWRNKWKPRIK